MNKLSLITRLTIVMSLMIVLFNSAYAQKSKWNVIKTNTTQNLNCVAFFPAPNNNNGIIVGNEVVPGKDSTIKKNGIIYFTGDGGCTWDTAISPTNAFLESLKVHYLLEWVYALDAQNLCFVKKDVHKYLI